MSTYGIATSVRGTRNALGAGNDELRRFNFAFRAEAALSRAELHDREVHIWHGQRDRGGPNIARFFDLLSSDEREHMARFRFAADREDYQFARGMLRTVLGHYLGIAPAEVRFRRSRHGKPSLALPQQASRVQFNLSHTIGYVLVGVCLDRSLGVDVERLRTDIEVEDLAARFFSSAEKHAIRALPEGERRRAFFHCWTRKESLLKAWGGGLLLPLDTFDVSVRPGVEQVSLVTRPQAEQARGWRIFDIPVPEEFAAAVSVECS
jgi:4'-phosphopantetheinyl transferase